MIKNVIFDLGGVILGRGFKNFGKMVSKCFAFLSGEQFPQCWHDFDRGTKSREEVVAELAELNDMSRNEVSEAVDNLFDKINEIPETVELIKQLKTEGYGIYILSNMPREYYRKMNRFEVFQYVDGAVISSEELLIKPDPRIYLTLLKRYDLQPAECLFVDDKTGNVEAARNLGLAAIEFDEVEKGIELVKNTLDDDRRNR